MSSTSEQAVPASALLADETRLGPVELRVADVERSLPFYERAIGLRVIDRDERSASLGGLGGESVVVLHSDPAARAPGRESGLYHYALLFSSREELARVGRRVAETRTRIDGASDHGTHEAIYLPDPDGIGIELACDRPREGWPLDPFAMGGPHPLDVGALFETIAGEARSEHADEGLRVGHVHLHVSDLEASSRFYHDGLGFAVRARMPHAEFVSAGGYHHHVAYNLWRGEGVRGASPDALGLINWTLRTAGEADAVRARLVALGYAIEDRGDGAFLARDPAGIAVAVA
ncbi:MAG TPA: VOC family protein [Solirubrobacteraceae bacterium]|jgi:catechol 2,3-dioxygenase|nr:VOC family protein [Solirubrobacteraceae bacterium]